jgi:hypothetical protein
LVVAWSSAPNSLSRTFSIALTLAISHARGMKQLLSAVDWTLVAPVVAFAAASFGVLTTEVRERIH